MRMKRRACRLTGGVFVGGKDMMARPKIRMIGVQTAPEHQVRSGSTQLMR